MRLQWLKIKGKGIAETLSEIQRDTEHAGIAGWSAEMTFEVLAQIIYPQRSFQGKMVFDCHHLQI